ncbi:hypothetical protein MMC25_002122 [Agyrium rufum]|nr:hypothetical protein [Agyrium rufum]
MGSTLRNSWGGVSLLTFISLASKTFQQQTCDPNAAPITPISIAVINVTLSDDGTVSRGINISAGTPPQSLAFTLRPDFNNTYFFDELNTECSNSTSDLLCGVEHGGNFDDYSSSTWSLTTQIDVATDSAKDTTGDFFGTDILKLNAQNSLSTFPLGVFRNNAVDSNVLGLGTNSSLMTALFNANKISSRAWSYWDGLTGATKNSQMDGQLVIGGFDKAKTKGENISIPLHAPNGPVADPFSTNCPTGLLVTVADIQLDFLNGTAPSIFGASHPTILYCIDATQPIITVPAATQSFIESFIGPALDRSTGIYAGGLLYDSYDAFHGDLVVTFPNTTTNITIPWTQLLVPDTHLSKNGNATIGNASQPVLRINPLSGNEENDLAVFGAAFLSSAYINVNYDLDTLTMWQANPTTQENLVGVASCPTTAAANSDTSSGSKTNVGAIVGGVIGGVIALALIIGALLHYRRRQRKRARADPANNEAYQAVGKNDRDPVTTGFGELHGDADHRPELDDVDDEAKKARMSGYPADKKERQWLGSELPGTPGIHANGGQMELPGSPGFPRGEGAELAGNTNVAPEIDGRERAERHELE